jgi:hypothetical protein
LEADESTRVAASQKEEPAAWRAFLFDTAPSSSVS